MDDLTQEQVNALSANLPKGFTCECGKFHRFGLYVLAHWEVYLTHTCDSCERQYTILKGEACLVTAPSTVLPADRSEGQVFASVATIRAALFDCLDANTRELYAFDCEKHLVTDEGATEARCDFVDAVIKRLSELMSPPHDGIKLENLCPRHRRDALPHPTTAVCGMCVAERKVKADGKEGAMRA